MSSVPPPPINRLPLGFLGYVDVKAMGSNPRMLEDRVRPIVDLAPFYRASSRVRFAGTTSVTAVGNSFSPTVIVPANKAWLIENFNVTGVFTLETADAFDFAMVIGSPDAINTRLWMSTRQEFIREGQTGAIAESFIGAPYVALPGYRFGVYVTQFTGLVPQALAVSVTVLEVDL